MSDVQITTTPVADVVAADPNAAAGTTVAPPVTAPASVPATPAGPVNAPDAPAAPPAPSAEVTIDTSQFVTKDDLAGFLTELKAAVAAAQPAAAVAAVTPPDFHLTVDEAPKEGSIVDYLGRPAQVLGVLETPRKDSAGNEWTQVVLHIGVFTQEHTVDAEQVTAS